MFLGMTAGFVMGGRIKAMFGWEGLYLTSLSLIVLNLIFVITQVIVTVIIYITNLFIYQARESLPWSQQGFWQPIFCRKRNLWSLCFDGRTKVKFLCIASMEKRKSGDKSIFHPFSFLMLPLSPGTQWIKAPLDSPNQNKGFINYVFCRNWAVRNPAGTRLDSV